MVSVKARPKLMNFSDDSGYSRYYGANARMRFSPLGPLGINRYP
jgi:hypothetical protein